MIIMDRRRALMGQSKQPLEYAEGLAIHFDGINNTGSGHDADVKTWTDIISNRTYDQYPTGSKIAFQDKCFNFDGGHYFQYPSTEQASWNTIEICYEASGNFTYMIFQSGSTTFPLTCVSRKNGAIVFGGGGAKSLPELSGKHTYACDGTNVYCDGKKVSSSGVTINWTAIKWNIGAYGTTTNAYLCKGKLYSIRCYKRVLSAEEIANNAAIDAVRFA